jgi:hypothetical protein
MVMVSGAVSFSWMIMVVLPLVLEVVGSVDEVGAGLSC